MAEMQTVPSPADTNFSPATTIAANIGATIRAYRQQKGMSQGDIEKRTGLLRCYLSRVENGHTVPSLETLQKIAYALDLHLSPPRELAILGPHNSDVARAALAQWDPRAVVAFGPADSVPLLEGKGLVDGKPAVYVCERFACRAPVTDPAGFASVT